MWGVAELEQELARLAGALGDFGFYHGPDGVVGHWRAEGRIQRSRIAPTVHDLVALLKELV